MEPFNQSNPARDAVVWRTIEAELREPAPYLEGLPIVDVGGGTGGFAVPLAAAGHRVIVVDPSPNALASLRQRADQAGVGARVTGIQGDADALGQAVEADSARLVLCHSVLEMLDEPVRALTQIARVTVKGAAVSLVVANLAGAVLARAYAGHVSEATALLTRGTTDGTETRLRRFDPRSLDQLVMKCGLVGESRHGIGIAADLASHEGAEPDFVAALRQFELEASSRSPYRDIAAGIHVLARRPQQ